GNPLDYATVQVFEGAMLRGGAKTDQFGNYTIKPLPQGKYTLKVAYPGFSSHLVQNILLGVNKRISIDIRMERKSKELNGVVITANKTRLIDASSPGNKSMTSSYSGIATSPTIVVNDAAAPTYYNATIRTESMSIGGGRS
ncbi:MAG TPA: hypothetical protein DCF44_03700, partial [Chitinophagaceae bacterium]|nr:hypothetical protein [Chitinophagaceae bacterium]